MGAGAERQPDQAPGQLSAVLLPRMLPGLANVMSQAGYEALAAVARTAGRVAYLAGQSYKFACSCLITSCKPWPAP